eukprot:7257610-Pyramimonas_sp.AAC.1
MEWTRLGSQEEERQGVEKRNRKECGGAGDALRNLAEGLGIIWEKCGMRSGRGGDCSGGMGWPGEEWAECEELRNSTMEYERNEHEEKRKK